MGIFDLFSIFDWVSPAIETARDIDYAITDGGPKSELKLSKSDLGYARQELSKKDLYVISEVWAAFNSEARIIIKERDRDEIIEALRGVGVDTWG